MNDFTPNLFDFDSSESGLTVDLNEKEGKEIDFFHYLLDYDLVAHIATETNKYCSSTWNKMQICLSILKLGVGWTQLPMSFIVFSGFSCLCPIPKKNLKIVLDNKLTPS